MLTTLRIYSGKEWKQTYSLREGSRVEYVGNGSRRAAIIWTKSQMEICTGQERSWSLVKVEDEFRSYLEVTSIDGEPSAKVLQKHSFSLCRLKEPLGHLGSFLIDEYVLASTKIHLQI